MVTTTANAADLYQYPPSEFRWRLWLLIERIDEVFVAAQKAGMCQPSLRDPRGDWARDHIDRDPFAARFGIAAAVRLRERRHHGRLLRAHGDPGVQAQPQEQQYQVLSQFHSPTRRGI